MADVFYTVLIIWLLWKIFGGTTRHVVYHRHRYEKPGKKEGEVTVSNAPEKNPGTENDRGEYVDYEEIKNGD